MFLTPPRWRGLRGGGRRGSRGACRGAGGVGRRGSTTPRGRRGSLRRDVRLERRLDRELDRSSKVAQALVASHSSPSQNAARREQAVLLAEALSRLPADHREVIMLHHLEGLTLADTARRMGRSVGSVEKLWVRGLAALRRSLGGDTHDPR
jgi:RNA polymerase sigma-70 factor (ECF subfamily)